MPQVLWAALFALAVLVREGSAPHSLALRSTAAAGMLPLLQSCMAAYKVRTSPAQRMMADVLCASGADSRMTAAQIILHAVPVPVPDWTLDFCIARVGY